MGIRIRRGRGNSSTFKLHRCTDGQPKMRAVLVQLPTTGSPKKTEGANLEEALARTKSWADQVATAPGEGAVLARLSNNGRPVVCALVISQVTDKELERAAIRASAPGSTVMVLRLEGPMLGILKAVLSFLPADIHYQGDVPSETSFVAVGVLDPLCQHVAGAMVTDIVSGSSPTGASWWTAPTIARANP